MKKWVFLLFFAICLGFASVTIISLLNDRVDIQPDDQNVQNQIMDLGTSERIQNIELTTDLVYQGNLLLVNNDYPVIEESIKSDVIDLFSHKELINGYRLLDSKIQLSEEVAQEFLKMIAAAENDGVRHFSINSGFRDFAEQSILYQEMGSDYALPAGYSEHNLGLSVDVGSTQMKMNKAPEGKWIEKNAWKYGFVLRYPKDKSHVTGILYEPWHIRYVGLPHSAIMKEKNFVLEEYMDYLKEEQNISATVDGEKYFVSYYPVSENTTIQVEGNSHYDISGNNMDGVIVTMFPRLISRR
jgi:zinc D-Ala-D-Ala carboxypeptidase